MKIRLYNFILIVLTAIFASCAFDASDKGTSATAAHKERRTSYSAEALEYVDLPTKSGSFERVKVTKGFFIVKTKADFNKYLFKKMGAAIHGVIPAGKDAKFWYVYKNDAFFLKKILKVEGVISAEYDFSVYTIDPPKKAPDEIVKPSPINMNSLLSENGETSIIPMGLTQGNLDKDPRSKAANYSLEITKALQAYKDVGYGTKKVLLGIIDTGFNYCHEDFWYTNDNGEKESILLFAKSAFLLERNTKNFIPIILINDFNDPEISYAKKFLEDPEMLGRFYEIPCPKIYRGGSPFEDKPPYDSPWNVFNWNWDDGSHGTHCAGVMAARGDNEKGIAGVAWKNTKIAAYKCFGGYGAGVWAIYGALADYLDYIKKGKNGQLPAEQQQAFEPYKDQGVYPVNMSLGGPVASMFGSSIMADCLAEGVLPVVAMGNDGKRILEFPAGFSGVITVGATTGRDEKTVFSSCGEWISVCAPGLDILSTGVEPDFNWPWGGYWSQLSTSAPWDQKIATAYETMSGTSMATPFVTGMLGYLLSFEQARGKTPAWIKNLIEATADPIQGNAPNTHNEYHGWGRVNVLKAAQAVTNGSIPGGTRSYAEGTYNVSVVSKYDKAGNDKSLFPNGYKSGITGEAVYAYKGAEVVGFSYTNVNGLACFHCLPANSDIEFVVTIDGYAYSSKVHIGTTVPSEPLVIPVDQRTVYISTFVPHKKVYERYNSNDEYTKEPDTVIAVYENGKFDAPVDVYDAGFADTMAFTGTPGKKYFAEVSCFEDPNTGAFRGGIYGFRIGFNSISDMIKGYDKIQCPFDNAYDKDRVNEANGINFYQIIAGNDCWEPNDDFEQANKMGDMFEICSGVFDKDKKIWKKPPVYTYLLGCLTHHSAGIDRDVYMFKIPEEEDE